MFYFFSTSRGGVTLGKTKFEQSIRFEQTIRDYRPELIIALACAVGTDISIVKSAVEEKLQSFHYSCNTIKISKELLEPLSQAPKDESSFDRAKRLMDCGNELRRDSGEYGILAKGAISLIESMRNPPESPSQSVAFIIDSIKNPEEIKVLRKVYGTGVYLFAVNESEKFRVDNMVKTKNMGKEDALNLCRRDYDEGRKYGQKTRDVFELADFHLSFNSWQTMVKEKDAEHLENENIIKDAKKKIIVGQVARIIEIMFSNPFITPTFDEYAMFMAYSSGLRSADLSRQIGAVIANDQNEIIALGANDCPRFGGGQYWPVFDADSAKYVDLENGRDYTRGHDSNKLEHAKIIDDIIEIFDFDNTEKGKESKKKVRDRLNESRIKYLTEYGRPVHAEMAAILSCARTGISLQNATLYCSTFPCHNCAKHIIGAGIKRVVFIEPYPKSKSLELYDDSLRLVDTSDFSNKYVRFEEFVGIGPRRFYDLFSLSLSSGSPLKRKDSTGKRIDWKATLRCKMEPTTYFEREKNESLQYRFIINNIKQGE